MVKERYLKKKVNFDVTIIEIVVRFSFFYSSPGVSVSVFFFFSDYLWDTCSLLIKKKN